VDGKPEQICRPVWSHDILQYLLCAGGSYWPSCAPCGNAVKPSEAWMNFSWMGAGEKSELGWRADGAAAGLRSANGTYSS